MGKKRTDIIKILLERGVEAPTEGRVATGNIAAGVELAMHHVVEDGDCRAPQLRLWDESHLKHRSHQAVAVGSHDKGKLLDRALRQINIVNEVTFN